MQHSARPSLNPAAGRRVISQFLLLLALITGGAAATSAAENTVVLEIQPTPAFPRNSEGSFVTLRSGRILFCYTQFYGGSGDESPARIVAITSDDSGRTWSKSPQVVVENEGGANVMSVSLLRLQDGRIGLFYIKKKTRIEGHPQVQFSSDEGATWSEPQVVVQAPGYYELNNDRAIQLGSGRLMLPIGSYRLKGTDEHTYNSLDFRAITMWYLSDDKGATWRESDQWLASPVLTTHEGLQESGIVELGDGALMGWFRTDLGAQYVSWSKDAGATWTAPVASELKSPTSSAGIKRLPGSDKLLGIWNDYSGQWTLAASSGRLAKNSNRRTPLVTGISSDGGRTWSQRKLLESDPDGWYCYTAIHFVDDAVLLAYCAGDSQVGGLNRLRIRRVELSWLTTP